MLEKATPFSRDEIETLAADNQTPFYVYDEVGIRAAARELHKAFSSYFPGYRNFFAVKATPTPAILKILREERNGVDCSSELDLELAHQSGFRGEEIFMTSNDTPASEFQRASNLGVIVNFDDLTHLEYYEKNIGALPALGCVRYNPGTLKKGANGFMGDPVKAKFGMTRNQVIEAYAQMKGAGIKRFAMHTMVSTNCLNPEYFAETARLLFEMMAEVKRKIGITFELANIGGGFGIPYKPEDEHLPVNQIAKEIKAVHDKILFVAGHPPVNVVTENGRFITGPHGYLVSRVRHVARKYENFVGLDASMADLMRPGMYGAYHHISVAGKEDAPHDHRYNVTGSLCEGNDFFARDRMLPEITAGDLVVIHDAGAHAHAMGFNYNGKLRPAEFLRKTDGTFQMIRRAQTTEDLLAQVKDLADSCHL